MIIDPELLSTIQSLYDANRFFDAYREAQVFLTEDADEVLYPPRACILLGRLANRLGSGKLLEKFFQKGRGADTADPYVRYYAGEVANKQNHLLHLLTDLEKDPGLSYAPPEIKAVAFGSYGWIYAKLRDFQKAYQYIKNAKSQGVDKAWVACCEAEVMLADDQWKKAEGIALTAWKMSPGMPQAAVTLGNILVRLGRLETAANLFLSAAQNLQSYETLITTIWYACALAERSDQKKRLRLADEAWMLSDRIGSLAPLADEETRQRIAGLQCDITLLYEDRSKLHFLAGNDLEPFFKTVVENITRNENKAPVILEYQPVYQKHNTCLPSSISTVVSAFQESIDEQSLVEELTYAGTAVWQAVDWLEERGFACRPFIPTPELCITLLENKLPFVLLIQTVYYYHAVAVIGVDEQAGVLKIHDPGYVRLDYFLLNEMDSRKDPYTPEALAVVPSRCTHLLDLIPDRQSEPYAAYLNYIRIQNRSGGKHGEKVLQELQKKYARHPFYHRLKAISYCRRGNPIEGIKLQEKLLNKYPNSHPLQKEMLDSYYHTGNTPTIMETLKRIVLRKKWPGIRARQPWQYPPGDYVARYADYIGINRSGLPEAEKLVWGALKREPYNSFLYHILGDLYYRHGIYEKSILPYRLAAMLEIEHNHFALAYCDANRMIKRETDGFDFLEKRTKMLGESLKGGEVWITLIQTYENYGYPEKAIPAMETAQLHRKTDVDLHSYAVDFWLRMGQKVKAGESFQRVWDSGHRIRRLQTATSFYHNCGMWAKALETARIWVAEAPAEMGAREKYSELLGYKVGRKEALGTTGKWMQENSENEYFEELHYRRLREVFDYQTQVGLLRKRLKRNPHDTWALREIGFLLLQDIDSEKGPKIQETEKEIKTVISRCNTLCPSLPVFLALKGNYFNYIGKTEKATALFLQALTTDPGYHYSYRRVWDCSVGFQEELQRKLMNQLIGIMFRQSGFKSVARDLIGMIAERFGVKEANQKIDRWLVVLPYDPELIVSKAEMLLYKSRSQSDTHAAVSLIVKAIERFPNFQDLKIVLVRAYQILNQTGKIVPLMRDILKHNPFNGFIRCQFADMLEADGKTEEAVRILKEGLHYNPLDDLVQFRLIRILWCNGNQEHARKLIAEGIQKIPEKIDFRRQLIDFLLSMEADDLSVELARDGVRVYPEGAYLWQILGDTLWRSRQIKDTVEIEDSYRTAIHLNSQLYDAADALSELLTNQHRYEEAMAAVEPMKKMSEYASNASARIAWIKRKRGDDDAMIALKDNIKRWPAHSWSWRLLLNWIQEDEQWEVAREMLEDVHPVMSDDPNFTAEKLIVLEQAGSLLERIEEEWKTLLKEFPKNQTVHIQRYDQLMLREALPEAGEVIGRIAAHFPDSPFVLARRAAYLAAADDTSGALECSIRMIQLPEELSSWCLNNTWKVLSDAAAGAEFIRQAHAVIQAGRKIHRYTFGFIIDKLDAGWLDQRQVVQYLEELLHSTQGIDQGYQTARVIEKICDLGHSGLVRKFWVGKKDYCRECTEIWQAVGYTLNIRREFEELKNWMKDWRNHPGCEMWALNNYMIGLQHGKDGLNKGDTLNELYTSSRFAIDNLHHDHTIRYIVSLYCMTCLWLGKDDQLCEYVTRFDSLLRDENSNYWFHSEYKWLPGVLIFFKELITSADHGNIRKLTSSVVNLLPGFTGERWVRIEWMKRIGVQTDFGRRLWIWFLLYLKTRH
ncbi:MAG: hypothetical protein C0403_05425 [Desulfobacterium sp.]|nr:hypothetical protein [Desulfobacterium sp.]